MTNSFYTFYLNSCMHEFGLICANSKCTNLESPAHIPSRSLIHSIFTVARTKYSGINPITKRPTPDWQKSINTFFVDGEETKENKDVADKEGNTSSGTSGKRSCDGSNSEGEPSDDDKENIRPNNQKASVISSDSEDSK